MYTAANQIYTAQRTLYLTAAGDTTNPNLDLPLRTLSQDEHYVSDVATQQDGVPRVTTDILAQLLPTSSNLPTDYNNPQQGTQQINTVPTTQTIQSTTTSSAAAAIQNSGETVSVPLQEGRY